MEGHFLHVHDFLENFDILFYFLENFKEFKLKGHD